MERTPRHRCAVIALLDGEEDREFLEDAELD
jgi:hypothetical protein